MVVMIFPLNLLIVRKQHSLQKFILKMKGKRVRLINEILSGIKVLMRILVNEQHIIRLISCQTKPFSVSIESTAFV